MSLIAHPHPTGGVAAARPPVDEMRATACIADWFAGLLLAPPDTAAVERQQGAQALAFIQGLGEDLERRSAASALCDVLASGPADKLSARFGHHYVLLFEGVSGPKSISLYESSYCGEGSGLFNAPFVAMQEILRALDIRVDGPCREPPDHLAIELAALATALRQGRPDIAASLATQLRGWVPAVAVAVSRSPHGGFYAHVFALLDAFLAAASLSWPLPGPAPLFHQEASHVHG
ncbi:molecular chaperone [Xanthobacteraceae bacterium A53D]